MNTKFDLFVEQWYEIAALLAQVSLVIAVVLFLLYQLLLMTKRAAAEKHDFISSKEIKYLWYSGLSIALSLTFFLNYLIVKAFYTSNNFELIFKTVVSAAIGFLVGYTINTYLNIYYPFILEKRLHKIRFRPRISTAGKEMTLLDEESEDVHLTEEMIEHENINAFEYDVWLDEESGEKVIEKYRGSLHLVICDNCNYRTSHEFNEEVIEEPTHVRPGQMIKRYKCFYCDHIQKSEVDIAPLDG